MPKSFLVRLKPAAESPTYHHDLKFHSYGPKGGYKSTKPSDGIAPNQPIAVASTTHHPQSHYDVMMHSPDSQSNSAMAMTSYQSSQSAMNTVHHHIGSSSKMTMPAPKYQHVPVISNWPQSNYSPSNNNAWYYSRLDYLRGQNFPGKGERLLDTGETSLPFCAKDNTMYGTQQCYQTPQSHQKSNRQKVGDLSTVPTAFKEFFSIEKILGKQYPDGQNNPATAVESLLPRGDQARSKHRAQRLVGTASKKPDHDHEDGGNRSKTDQPSEKRNEDDHPTIISRQTALDNPDGLKSQQSSPEKIHACAQCNKTFNRASNLRAHARTHSDHKPYKCDYCGKGFHQKIDKRIHHYTHTGEKPHKCKKCGRGFKQLTHLNYHLRTHSDTHMYHCTYCGKGFNQKGNLQAHIYGHTGQRPFKCEICAKGFTLRSTLNTHLRTHAPKKPFVCEHCNKAFYQKNALKMHRIASHPIINGQSIL